MPQSVESFLREKIQNLFKFLESHPKLQESPVQKAISDLKNTLMNRDMESLILFIMSNIAPHYPNNLLNFIVPWIQDYVKLENFLEKDKKVLEDFLKCFVEVLQQ